jgi:uncharacterized small protein (DUF1192 family)
MSNAAPQEARPIRIADIDIPVADQTPLVLSLLAVIQRQEQELQALRDEIQRLKGTTQRPKISPSRIARGNVQDRPSVPRPRT